MPESQDQAETAHEHGTEELEAEFVWQLLDSGKGTHLHFLDPDYAPVGLIDLIVREPRVVLDVGCFCGATGALIKQRWPNASVIGIEPLAEAAEHAARRIDQVINSTLEAVEFEDAGILPGTVDTVVLADVLEHMYNPWAALETIRTLLTDDGVVLASIPNVRNLALIHNLVNGRWKYEGVGLLDITHIRFFTLTEVRELFAQTGFEIAAVTHNIDPACAQLLNLGAEKERINVQFGSLVINNVSSEDIKELATLQFFVRAARSG